MGDLELLETLKQDFQDTKKKAVASLLPCLQGYHSSLKTMKETYLDSTQKQKDLNSKVKTLEDKHHEMLNKGNILASERTRVENANKDILDKIEEKEEEFREQEKKIANRHKAVSFYEDRLAMKIKSVGEGHILFIFKQIDRDNPELCCLLQLLVEDNAYKVTKCVPELTGVDVLLSELNSTNDLHKFVVSIRMKFRQSV